MKTQLFTNITIAIFLILMSVVFTSAQEPKTVTDFYLALPEHPSDIVGISHNFDGDSFVFSSEEKGSKAAIANHRKSLIKIADIKNGYLRLEGLWDGWMEIALFKKADGTYLAAVSDVGCGPGCGGPVIFLIYKTGKWTDVTRQVFPFDSSFADIGYFKLPRVGTTIELNGGEDCGDDKDCEKKQKLDEFKWNGAKFVRK